MTSASRGFAGDSDAWFRRPEGSASDASADSASLAVAIDDRNRDDVLAEFDRRVALFDALAIEDRRFALADFAEEHERVFTDRESDPLPLVLEEAGPMPAEVAEECVRGTLAALRSAHDRRWSHGTLSLDAFLLDPCGVVRLSGVGRLQRETLLRAAEDDRDGIAIEQSEGNFDQSEGNGGRWNEAFLTGAAEDFRSLGPQVVAPLLQTIDGQRPLWAERLLRCLDGLDGTIGSLEDVDHAWQAIDACFQANGSVDLSSPVAPEAIEAERINAAAIPVTVETQLDPVAADPADPAQGAPAASRLVLFWFCVVGGLAAMAGTLAAVIVGR